MLVLAISARALRILDVSVAALAPVPGFLSWLFSGMKSLGGVPIGVVDPESTDNEMYQKPFSTKFFFFHLRSNIIRLGFLPFEFWAVSFCLKPESIALGKVFPRSQISMSFRTLP